MTSSQCLQAPADLSRSCSAAGPLSPLTITRCPSAEHSPPASLLNKRPNGKMALGTSAALSKSFKKQRPAGVAMAAHQLDAPDPLGKRPPPAAADEPEACSLPCQTPHAAAAGNVCSEAPTEMDKQLPVAAADQPGTCSLPSNTAVMAGECSEAPAEADGRGHSACQEHHPASDRTTVDMAGSMPASMETLARADPTIADAAREPPVTLKKKTGAVSHMEQASLLTTQSQALHRDESPVAPALASTGHNVMPGIAAASRTASHSAPAVHTAGPGILPDPRLKKTRRPAPAACTGLQPAQAPFSASQTAGEACQPGMSLQAPASGTPAFMCKPRLESLEATMSKSKI